MPRKSVRRLIAYPLPLVMIALFMTLPGIADRMILYPTTGPVDPMGAQRREVSFEGGTLEIWTAHSPGALRAATTVLYVLSFEGNASRAEWTAVPDALQWDARPVEVWSVNYPGYGGSTGPARLKRLPPAALAAYDALAQEAAGRPIVVNGSSLGSTLALDVAAERPVAGLVLRNPPPLQNMILARFGWWNLWIGAATVAWKIPREMNSLVNAPKVTAPAVFVLSGEDEVVPPKYQRKVVDAYAGEKRIIELPGAAHNAPLDGSRLQELHEAFDWLWEHAVPQVR